MARRGFMLVAALLLLSILMLLGMGLLGSRAARYEGAVLHAQFAQARGLARAGLEATRIKLLKDRDFPPPSEAGQAPFVYSEEVLDLDNTTVLGSYTVAIETRWRSRPYHVLRISSLGRLGPADNPQARAEIVAELDISPRLRNDPAQPNPRYFQWIHWSEEGN